MAGRLTREGSPVRVRHVAEVLAGMTGDVPAIGEGREVRGLLLPGAPRTALIAYAATASAS